MWARLGSEPVCASPGPCPCGGHPAILAVPEDGHVAQRFPAQLFGAEWWRKSQPGRALLQLVPQDGDRGGWHTRSGSCRPCLSTPNPDSPQRELGLLSPLGSRVCASAGPEFRSLPGASGSVQTGRPARTRCCHLAAAGNTAAAANVGVQIPSALRLSILSDNTQKWGCWLTWWFYFLYLKKLHTVFRSGRTISIPTSRAQGSLFSPSRQRCFPFLFSWTVASWGGSEGISRCGLGGRFPAD